jgi:hypothetical protein
MLLARRRPPRLLLRATAAWLASRYGGSGDLLDLTGGGRNLAMGAAGAAPLWLDYGGAKYVYFPGSASNSLTVTLSASTVYDYTVTYSDGTTDTGTVTSNGSGVATFGTTDAKFAGLKVSTIDVTADGGGATLALFDASLAAQPYATVADSLGKTWTFNRSTSGRKLVVVDRDCFLLGADDLLTLADDAAFDFAANESFTVLAAVRRYGTPSGTQAILSKRNSGGTSLGWDIRYLATGNAGVEIGDATNQSADAAAFTAGTAQMIGGRRNTTTDKLSLIRSTTVSAGQTDSTTGTLANAIALRVGSHSGVNFADMEFFGAAIFRRALSDAEIQRIKLEFLG